MSSNLGVIMTRFLVVSMAFFGAVCAYGQSKSICGSVDSRAPSYELPIGRLISHLNGKDACTGTMISERCAITAGHCNAYSIMEFNTPLSKNGWQVHSAPEDIYFRDRVFGRNDLMPGKDWLVFSLKANAVTSMYPGAVQGFIPVNLNKPNSSFVRVTGYGMDNDSNLTYTQQSADGELLSIDGDENLIEHRVDTYGGNSGSAIVDLETLSIIGIHTHGDCIDSDSFPKSSNMGTLIWANNPLIKAIQECLASE